MICVDVRSGSWLSIPLKLCLLPSSCSVYCPHPVLLELLELVGLPKPSGLGV